MADPHSSIAHAVSDAADNSLRGSENQKRMGLYIENVGNERKALEKLEGTANATKEQKDDCLELHDKLKEEKAQVTELTEKYNKLQTHLKKDGLDENDQLQYMDTIQKEDRVVCKKLKNQTFSIVNRYVGQDEFEMLDPAAKIILLDHTVNLQRERIDDLEREITRLHLRIGMLKEAIGLENSLKSGSRKILKDRLDERNNEINELREEINTLKASEIKLLEQKSELQLAVDYTVETIEENRGEFEEKEKEIQRKEKLVEAEQKIQKADRLVDDLRTEVSNIKSKKTGYSCK
jgi:DNA repair exonuclease SbcCD ATPase subunit